MIDLIRIHGIPWDFDYDFSIDTVSNFYSYCIYVLYSICRHLIETYFLYIQEIITKECVTCAEIHLEIITILHMWLWLTLEIADNSYKIFMLTLIYAISNSNNLYTLCNTNIFLIYFKVIYFFHSFIQFSSLKCLNSELWTEPTSFASFPASKHIKYPFQNDLIWCKNNFLVL